MEPEYLEDQGVKARIVADSVNENENRVTSFEVVTHRFTLAEWNTHCLFSRNSASSRAIPVGKQLDKYLENPAYPIEWPCEKPGMSGGALLEGADLEDARRLFGHVNAETYSLVHEYVNSHEPAHRLHKSLLNRLLEPMQWHTMLITAANYENFFDLRVSPHAQPELRVAAELMRTLYLENKPDVLRPGQWHLPYLRSHENIYSGEEGTSVALLEVKSDRLLGAYDAREICSSRCAATSYETQWAEKGYDKEIERYRGLTTAGHWSPLEHVCTPWLDNQMLVSVPDPEADFDLTGQVRQVRRVARLGKFVGWLQWRHVVEARQGTNTYR